MKLVIDMNLSPKGVAVLKQERREALPWATVGDPRAWAHTIMDWARIYFQILNSYCSAWL